MKTSRSSAHSALSRSEIMKQVGKKNTAPEMAVRRTLHAMGYRFRLHKKDLPGCPDVVLPKYRLCIFVHGCFWHRHAGCRLTTTPATNREFWLRKFEANVIRDARVSRQLGSLGWDVVVVWECETRGLDTLRQRLDVVLPKRVS